MDPKKKRSLKSVDIVWILIGGILVFGGIGLLSHYVYLLQRTNGNLGNTLVLILGIVCVLFGVFLKWFIKALKRWRWVRLLACLLGIGAVLFGSVALFLVVQGNTQTTTYEEEAIVILGAAVHGSRVSATLAGRLDTGFENYLKNPESVIVVSGGQGAGEDVTEAFAMKAYLVGKGVPEDKVIEEGRSTSTYENFAYSKEILDKEFDTYRVTYVTNDFHSYRAGEVARKVGLEVTSDPSPTWKDQLLSSYLREVLAVIAMWMGRE